MFQEYRDKKLLEEFIYSSSVDTLLTWGRTHLLAPEDSETLQQMETLSEALSQAETLSENLAAGLAALSENADEALKFFELHPYIDENSQAAAEVATACEILDHVVFLAEAIDAFPTRTTFPVGFCRGVKQLLENVTVYKAPSAPRLIPINHWRREMAALIPEEHRYLFPWYGHWNDVPPETLALLIDQWQAVTDNAIEGLALDPEILEPLLIDLTADRDLLAHIRRHVRMEELIPKAIESSLALRLFITSEKEAANYAVPASVETRGLGACALRLIENRLKKRATEVDNLEAMFMTAFCAPFLTDQTRITLFSRIEADLHRMDRLSLPPGGMLAGLVEWADDKRLSGKELAKEAFNRWLDDLTEIASVVAIVPDDTVAEAIQGAVNSMLDWRPPIKEGYSTAAADAPRVRFRDRIAAFATERLYMLAPRATVQALAVTDKTEQMDAIAFTVETKNIIDLPLVYDRRGKLRIPGRHPESAALENIRENLLRKARIYWNAVFKIAEDPAEKRLYDAPKLEKDGETVLAKLDKAPYQYIVVCISPKADLIEKAMTGKELTDEEKQQILFIRYQ